MGYIYKITNDINNKVYIGKCCSTIEDRYAEHLRDRFKRKNEKRPLYSAMNKYGIEHFQVEQVEECDDIKLSEQEQYWINYYDSYNSGYNATLGGDGSLLYNHSAILQMLKDGIAPITIADKIGCCRDIIYDLAKANSIRIEANINLKKPVEQYDKLGNFIQSFPSIRDAGDWCVTQGKAKGTNQTARSKISGCLTGTNPSRKTAYGYIWKYAE